MMNIIKTLTLTMVLMVSLMLSATSLLAANDVQSQQQSGIKMESDVKSPKIAILLYEEADELDIFGPREIFTAAAMLGKRGEIYTVSATGEAIRLLGGTRVIPDYSFATAPKPDIIIVPGAMNTAKATGDKKILAYIAETAKHVQWVVGVCSGSEVLVAAGPARGKKITSHHLWIDGLRKVNGEKNVLSGVRYVRDGNLLTSAGVSAGIDMSLWLVGQLYSVELARKVQEVLEYYPAPPYAGEV
jgi:transcriptional regulator GlxA family with amidase domain